MDRERRSQKSVLCPVCSTGRELAIYKGPRFKLIAGSGFTFVLALGLVWSVDSWALRVLIATISGLTYFVGFEALHQARYRNELVCPVCHFDPVLYRRSPERAKERCLDSLKMREDIFLSKWRMLKQDASDK